MVKKNYPRSYRRLFPHVSEWEKVFLGPMASHNRCRGCNTTVWSPCQIGVKARRTSLAPGLYLALAKQEQDHESFMRFNKNDTMFKDGFPLFVLIILGLYVFKEVCFPVNSSYKTGLNNYN